MDRKEIHEAATAILAKVLELPSTKALKIIEEECGNNAALKTAVLDLYREIMEEEEKPVPVIKNDPSSSPIKQNTTRKVGRKNTQFRSKIVSDWTKILFGNKRNRLFLTIAFLTLLLVGGIIMRNIIRTSILNSEKEEKVALLNTNKEILERWISSEKKQIERLARNPELIRLAVQVDSLERLDNSYELLRNSEVAREITRFVVEEAKYGNYLFLSLLSSNSPKDLLSNSLIDSTGITKMFTADLGEKIYKDYLRAKNGQTIFIPPINDYDLINNFNKNVQVGVWCNFLSPIRNTNNQVVAIIAGSYLAKNEFSQILQLSKHGTTSETYAFNNEGVMLSASRFTDTLRSTYLLDFNPKGETLYTVELKDPEGNILTGYQPDKPQNELKYTEIVQEALNHLEAGDTIFSGSIMTPYPDYRGIDVIGSYMWLPEYNFGLITEEDASEALSALAYFRYTFFVFYFTILVLSFLLYNSNVRIARIGKKVDDFSQLGQYKLREKLGEGGFGEVFKAEHNFLKTPVAIKILKNEFADTDMLDRFEKEVKITSSLSHPNTIKVYDYGTTENNNFYYVMEYLNGISIDKIVSKDNEVPISRGIYILYHLCLSIKEAHEKGLVHRDIKPMNIMLCNQGGAYDVVKVLDFGLVKNIETSISQQTQINRIGGTPMFMAPERLRDPFHTDQRVDIYAIGAVGLYLFSGQFLLELISQKMLSGQETLQGDFGNNLIDRKDIPQDLKDFLNHCIHFNPEKRPENINILIDFFEQKNSEHPWTRKDAMQWWKTYDVYS